MKKVFINPFEKYSAATLFVVGLLAMLIGSSAGYYFNARYDGVIDLHFVEKVGLYEPFFDLVISIGITAVMLFIIGKFSNPKTRFIDLLNASLIAKIPFYLLTVFNFNGAIFKSTEKLVKSVQKSILTPPDISTLLPIMAFGLTTLAAVVLAVVLWFNGYKVATNVKGTKSVFLFVLALLVAEILSKIAISLLP